MSKLFKVTSLPQIIKKRLSKRIKSVSSSVGKSEAQIEQEICSHLQSRNIFFLKIKIKGEPIKLAKGIVLVKNPNVGFADIMVCYHGLLLLLEVKKNGGICSYAQLEMQAKIRKAGGIYEFVTSVGEVETIINFSL